MPSPSAGTVARSALVAALKADLIGPYSGDEAASEVLPIAPSRWYLTGFLAPKHDRETQDPTAEDEFASEADEEDEGDPAPEPEPKQKNVFPASMGLSVLLPPNGSAPESVRVSVSFAEYIKEKVETGEGKKKRGVWRRVPQPVRSVDLPLNAAIEEGVSLPDTPSIRICGKLGAADAPGLTSGARALSVFVVNERSMAGEADKRDEQMIFQVGMEVSCERGFLARPNRAGEGAPDLDDQTNDLQFRNHYEWAVGHGVAVEVPESTDGPVTVLRTTWVPLCEVKRVKAADLQNGVVTAMEDLAKLPPVELVQALEPIATAYDAWIEGQAAQGLDSEKRTKRQKSLVKAQHGASSRIRAGIALLAANAEVRESFQLMNEAMAMAARQRSPGRYAAGGKPSWRLFQLAFVLLSLVGVADETHPDRSEVELIFFPTGGGKTEAYLGVIAFTLLLRRIRGQMRPDGGLGVAVLLRYTLRLLTLDQLGRAATLVCALEMLRKRNPKRLGDVRFAVGLWVGRAATANTLDQVKKLVLDYKNSASKTASSPFPLTDCPWCGRELGRGSLALEPSSTSPDEVVVSCVPPSGEPPSSCDFSPRNNREGLPVLFVDEQIYRELPSFLVATVDKFAMLPWRGETGLLFGRALAREGRRVYGPLDKVPKTATKLPDGLRPPELIVQDELHLISGPLGTMVGLYETAIEGLCSRVVDGKTVGPKIVASTATVRRAREQIRSLFGRKDMSLFPPPGIDASETFFATLDREAPGRLYAGVAASGRPLKAILLRTYVALLSAAQKRWDPKGDPAQQADAYMTLAGYFNSLRELGGMRRLVEDDVRTRAQSLEDRVFVGSSGAHPWGKNRRIDLPVELTSREKAAAIKLAKKRLDLRHTEKDHVDVLLASNMISVGVDIDRLGLMVVAGQPKSTSEYIQATSRVGRQYPGLVVTCFNVRRPRDRSHYERFVAYHESFYRHVEATSLTPFSGPALERGLAGMFIALARLSDVRLTPPTSAMLVEPYRSLLQDYVKLIAQRAGEQKVVGGGDSEEYERTKRALEDRGMKLLDTWTKLVREARDEAAAKRCYSPLDKDKTAGKPLLVTVLDEGFAELPADEKRFQASMSMRDVEPSVHLWLERRALGGPR